MVDSVLHQLQAEFSATPITLILALLAIIFATIQFFDSLHLKTKMRTVLSRESEVLTRTEAVAKRIEGVGQQIEGVSRTLSSRYVGTFPKNLKEINEVVSHADRFVMLLTDWVGYAMYSAPEVYEKYTRHIRDLRRPEKSVPIYVIAYDAACCKEHFKDQFPPERFEEEKTKLRFTTFFDFYRKAKPKPKTYEAFLTEMLAIEEELRADLTNLGVQIQELNQRSLVLLWMEDGEEAVFCFQTHGGNERGLSFRTRDIGLLTSLRDLFGARWTGNLPPLPHEHRVEASANMT
jgi:hypothetical protein